MIKNILKLLSILFFAFVTLPALAQPVYNNEWIDYSKSYLKIPVASTGIFRLYVDELKNLGVPTTDASLESIKLFHRGKEQALDYYPSSATLASHFEFYGKPNNGTLDSVLYGTEKQLNKYYNLFSDTAYYFLTWDGIQGKRMPKDSAALSGNVAQYHLKDTLSVFTTDYAMGALYSSYTHESSYNTGEGWTSTSLKGSNVYKIKTPHFIDRSVPLNLAIQLVGRNETANTFTISVGKSLSNLKVLDNISFYSVDSYVGNYQLSDLSYVGDSIYVVIDNANLNARFSLSYLSLTYPQEIAKANLKFSTIPANSADHVVVPLIKSLNAIYDITDESNIRRIAFQQSDSIRFMIPNRKKNTKLYFHRDAEIVPKGITKVNFKTLVSTANTFIMLYHPLLTAKTGVYNNVVKSYADYRASSKGGGYDTVLLSIMDVYNQFSYGEKTPLAIRKMCEYVTKDSLKSPHYLFLIGKAYEYGFANIRRGKLDFQDLVPTYGTPGSDIKFSSNVFKDNKYVPAIPTGRYTAQNALDLANYFDKIKEHEGLAYDQLWRKNMVHLSGGKESSQIAEFRGIVDGLKQIVEGEFKGAQVSTFSKSTSDIQIFNISETVNKGTSVITFFGHSSPTSNDINIGDATDPFLGYNNKGKYPIIILHGCKAGNPFTASSFGENWMKASAKGAIAMMGNTDYAYVDLLKTYSETFYKTAFTDSVMFSAGIGDLNKEVTNRLPKNNDPRSVAQIEQMVLQGDPSLVLFGPKHPDYYTNNDQLFLKSFDGKPVTAVSDSFAIGIAISNFGRVTSTGFMISVERTVDGVKKNLPVMKVNGVAFKDTVYYVLYARDLATAGQNSIKVHLNFNEVVVELNKNNNIGVLDFYVPKSGLNCLLPQEFSIVNTPMMSLVSQATDVLSDNRDYVFEIDTAYQFNSSLYQTSIVNAGATAIWKNVNLFSKLPANADSVVFFWRVKFKNLLPGEFTVIAQSSFVYIKNSAAGWSQTKFEQFNKDDLVDGLLKDSVLKKWTLGPKKQKISVSTKGGEGNYKSVLIKINDFPVVKNGSCEYYGGDGMYALAFDKTTLKPYTFFEFPLHGTISIMHCSAQPVNRFVQLSPSYAQWPDYKSYFKQFVDSVKTGDFVLLVSAGNAYFESWSDGNNQPPLNKYLDKKVAELGCTKLPLLKDGHPYIFLGQKGGAPLVEIIADSKSTLLPTEQIIKLDTVLQSASPSSALISTMIGPTTQWGNFYRTLRNLESPSQDKWSIDVLGYNLKGEETILLKDTALADGFDLSTVADAKTFPYLKIKVNVQDFGKLTPPQFKKLQVVFEPVPEGTVVLEGSKYKNIGMKQEGDSVVINYAFSNIFNKDFKNPLLVKYKLLTEAKEVLSVTDTVYKVLMPDSTLKFKKVFNTTGHVGNNVLEVFVNPLNQPEQLFDNNRWVIPFGVVGDKQNPLLDVYFDGVRIMNGDVVSPNPDIQIVLKDENKFLIKKDTIGMSIYIKKCETCDYERILFSNPDLLINYPSSSNNNRLSINYYPKNLPDGKYTLRVQGADASNNISGLQPYQIVFEVINKSSVSNFYPYPNPFSSATRFVYTLTGGLIPDEVKIQILTATGKVVREVSQNEIGQLRVGTHQTDFVWNGTDEFGDKLANGVYLYRVILKVNGQNIDLRKTAGDKAFNDGWGKMYILR
ncbi:MAG: hypothetical protein RL060_395 [Bacteroidota bacterium]